MSEVADVYEALEKLRKWKPIYLALLKTCPNKEQAVEAFKFLLKIAEDDNG
jgi:hypothetical protein